MTFNKNFRDMDNDSRNIFIRDKYKSLYTHKNVRQYTNKEGYEWIHLDINFMSDSLEHFKNI